MRIYRLSRTTLKWDNLENEVINKLFYKFRLPYYN